MPAFGDYIANAILDHLFNNTQHTSPASVYLSLHTAVGASSSSAAWAATELTGAAVNYVRLATGPTYWGAPGSKVITSILDATFATAGSDWGVVTHVGIWDASTSGNLYFYGALSASKTVLNGDAPRFATGNLTVTLL